MNKLGRNDPCLCGSGKKYKKRCFADDEEVLISQTINHRKQDDYNGWGDEELDSQMEDAWELDADNNDEEEIEDEDKEYNSPSSESPFKGSEYRRNLVFNAIYQERL